MVRDLSIKKARSQLLGYTLWYRWDFCVPGSKGRHKEGEELFLPGFGRKKSTQKSCKISGQQGPAALLCVGCQRFLAGVNWNGPLSLGQKERRSGSLVRTYISRQEIFVPSNWANRQVKATKLSRVSFI